MELYVSPKGNDNWSGRRKSPASDGSDGPLATLAGAVARIGALKNQGALCGPVTVFLRGGNYWVSEPVIIKPAASWPVTFKPYQGERAVISGGVRILDWKVGRAGGREAWLASLPEVRDGKWSFRQLFVNGRRAPRPRRPKKGLFRMQEVPGLKLPAGWGNGGQTKFVCRPGDVRPFRNINDVEVVYLHFWIEERSPIESFDPAKNLVTMSRPSTSAPVGSFGSQLADYYLDNVAEDLSEPGEWYLDRKEGTLTYLPRPGQTPENTEIIAPKALQLIGLLGEPEKNAFVEHVRFEGLVFAHTDWRHPAHDGATVVGSSQPDRPGGHSRRHSRGQRAAASQAACDVPGVITMEAARYCALEDCLIEHVGWYGVEIGDACSGIRVVGCTIRDMGAGGVKINGAAACDPDVLVRRTGLHLVSDNVIEQGGRVFHSAVGVLCMNAFGVRIAHNLIRDIFYSGVSCGWEWGYHESVSRDNVIEYNHIYNIGQGLLSDMGGIYTLGVQPGTVIRNNLIHDVRSAHYGGWCIYPDEGSSHILIENNVCYNADRQAFHQHYGRENLVINNIFAFGGEAVAAYSRAEEHMGFTMIRNILVTDGKPVFSTGYSYRLDRPRHRSDLNLIFDVSGRQPFFLESGKKKVSLARWRALGLDQHSIVADPGFCNLNRMDFRLRPDSPALKIGFRPIDLSRVGPRPASKRDM